MRSDNDSKVDVGIKIQKILVSIYDITLKIKKELAAIEELLNEDGQLSATVNEANLTLSKKVQEMGMDVEQIIGESAKSHENGSEPNLLGLITSTMMTEKLLEQMDG